MTERDYYLAAIMLHWGGESYLFQGDLHGNLVRQISDTIMGWEECQRPRHQVLAQLRTERRLTFGYMTTSDKFEAHLSQDGSYGAYL